nr:hypothetical protein Iba_chr12fCG16980 [Ipomoea batatas]
MVTNQSSQLGIPEAWGEDTMPHRIWRRDAWQRGVESGSERRLVSSKTIDSDCIVLPALSADANSQCPGVDTKFAKIDAPNSFNSGNTTWFSKRISVRDGSTPESTRRVALSSKLDRLYRAFRLAILPSGFANNSTSVLAP